MMKALLIALLLLSGCASTRIDPPVYNSFKTKEELMAAAQKQADKDGGFVTGDVADTHSMEPLIYGNDRLVVSEEPFKSGLDGRVVTLYPEWDPTVLEAHRIVGHDQYGYMVEGDNVSWRAPNEGALWRMTYKNFVGEVVGIYRLAK